MHRWKDAHARSTRACCVRELNNTGLPTFLAYMHGRAILDQGTRYLAYSVLIIHFKEVGTYEVKKCSPYNFRGIAYFYNFFDVSQLSLQTLLGQTSPMPWVKGLKSNVSSSVALLFGDTKL